MRYFSDLVVAFLREQDIDYVSFNPGASFRGIHDSLVNAPDAPAIVMCCHEEIAVAVAHGYHKASGRHMAVLVHANVGLLHAGMALFNAWCDRVPLLVIGGNGPVNAEHRRPWIDWIHTSQNIGSVVQDFVKWWDQPVGQWSTMESLYRAFRVMRTEVQAPVYVSVDSETQEEELAPQARLLTRAAAAPPALPPVGEAEVLALAVGLRSARMPVIIVDFSGRDPATVRQITMLAEKTGAAVIDRGNRFNIANTHPQNLSGVRSDLLRRTDYVLAIEVQDLVGALGSFLPLDAQARQPAGLPVVTLGSADLQISRWAADYQQFAPAVRPLIGDTAATLTALIAALDRDFPPSPALSQADPVARRHAIAEEHATARRTWEEEADRPGAGGAVTVAGAVKAIGGVVCAHDFVLANSGSLTIDGWVRRLWRLERPGCHLGLNGGGGLGYGPGAAIGAAIAYRHDPRLVVNLQADGDLLYTPSALWTLAAYGVPMLVVVMNNRLYLNSQQHAERIAANRGRGVEQAHIATSFYDNPVDFVALARSFNLAAPDRVERVEEIAPTIRRAIDFITTNGKPMLVEIIME